MDNVNNDLRSSGGGTRTPDTRIMIPLLWPAELLRPGLPQAAATPAITQGGNRCQASASTGKCSGRALQQFMAPIAHFVASCASSRRGKFCLDRPPELGAGQMGRRSRRGIIGRAPSPPDGAVVQSARFPSFPSPRRPLPVAQFPAPCRRIRSAS